MSCKCATYNGEGRYNCSVSGDSCMFLIPDSKVCAEKYGEGPDAEDIPKCGTCANLGAGGCCLDECSYEKEE